MPVRELDVGDRVGAYRLMAPIASGGMGKVFRAEHEVLRRPHAVKVLHARVMERDPRAAERLHAEARAASRVRHPSVVEVADAGQLADGRPFVVMELVEGPSLCEHAAGMAMPAQHAVAIARQLAGALTTAHACGVIHADVSPANVIVDLDLRAKLIDFGLARVDGEPCFGHGELVHGTPAYMAPERFRGTAPDQASDQYALGIIIHEMLSGSPPFSGETVRELYFAHLRGTLPELDGVPRGLNEIVSRCLAKLPGDRFPGMAAVADALEALERALEAAP